MTAKEIYESIDLAQVPQDLATKLRQIEKATKGFTIQSDKIDTFLRGVYAKLKEKKPTALKNLKVEEKIVKKEVKKGKETQVVEDLEYKVKGTKNVTRKTPTPSEPKRKENPQQEAKRTRKKGETAAAALARVMSERKEAEKKADSMVSKTSEALKELEQMLQSDPKLAGYPRTYGNQSKRIDAKKDAQIKAMPAGKRVSKKGHKNQYGPSKGGRVYWENRDNRSDRYAPNFPNKVFLAVGGELDDLGFPHGETYIVVDVSPSGDKKIIKSTTDYLTAMMSAAVARSAKSSKDARVLIVGKDSKKVLHETFEAGGEITIMPYPLVNNPDALVGTTSMTELFECGGVTAYQEGGEVFVTPYPLTNAGSADYVAGSNTMSNMFADGGQVSVNEDIKKRFDVDFYKGNGDRQTSHEEIIRGDKFSDVVSQATKVAKSKGMNYVEFYYKDAFIGSIDRRNGYEFKKGRNFEKSPLSVNKAKGGFIAMYNGKRAEIDADTLFEAKKKAIQELKVPKSKQGLLSVMANRAMENEDFRFMAKGGKIREYDDVLVLSKNKLGMVMAIANDIYYVQTPFGETFETTLNDLKKVLSFQKGGQVKFERDYYGYSARVPYNGRTFLVEMGEDWNAPLEEVFISDGFTLVDKDSQTAKNIYLQMLKAKKDAEMPKYEDGGEVGEYPFEEGDDYYTIENGKVIYSVWDDVSEEIHDENPNKIYFSSEEEAKEYLTKFAKGGKLPKNIKYYGVNEIKEYRLKNGDKIDPSKTFVDSGVYVSATKTMKPKEEVFQQKLEFKTGGATNWKEDYIYIPRYEIEEVVLDENLHNGQVIQGDYVVSGIYLPKSDRTKMLEKEMKARMKKMETGGTIVAADPSAAMEDLNQTYGFESVYEKGGRLGFAGLARKVAKRYEGKAVPKKYQEEYGKTYSKAEALEVGRKVAAKVYRQQQAMMEAGGEVTTPYPLTNGGSAEYVAGSNTMSNMFAQGGSLMGHGLRVGDKIVKDLGYVLKVANEDGDMVYIDLANGYRGAEPPLPFEHGGGVMVGDIAGLAKKYNKSGHEVVMKIGEGEKVEMEHTDNPKVARKIALDHIAEDWDYYAKLKKLGL